MFRGNHFHGRFVYGSKYIIYLYVLRKMNMNDDKEWQGNWYIKWSVNICSPGCDTWYTIVNVTRYYFKIFVYSFKTSFVEKKYIFNSAIFQKLLTNKSAW